MSGGRRARSGPRLAIEPATRDRWPDVERLFGDRGACGGCWCMAWRLPRREYDAGKGARNKAALKRLTAQPVPPGIIGYHAGEPIAWCAVAPRAAYPALARSRVLRPVDDRPVWSVSCLFVRKDQRRSGVASAMLRAAARFAAGHGARIVEGYPVIPTSGRAPDVFLWTGPLAAFQRAGFSEVLRHSPGRPIVRRRTRA